MRSTSTLERLSIEDLQAEGGAVLPTKEVLSVPLLDLNVDIDLALDLAAPIDLAMAGNANAVLPINGAVSANALGVLSGAQAGASQGVALDQFISGSAIAHGHQTSGIDQTGGGDSGATESVASLGPAADHPATTGDTATPSNAAVQPATETQPAADADAVPSAGYQPVAAAAGQPVTEAAQPAAADGAQAPPNPVQPAEDATPAAELTTPDVADTSLDGGLLNVDVNVDLDSKLAAPIAGAVALNANVAAPVNASVAANVGTIGSEAIAVSDQTAIISQQMEDVTAEAITDQDATIDQ
jgi:hypothetical protein